MFNLISTGFSEASGGNARIMSNIIVTLRQYSHLLGWDFRNSERINGRCKRSAFVRVNPVDKYLFICEAMKSRKRHFK